MANKRYGKEFDKDSSLPAKRAKIEAGVVGAAPVTSRATENDDLWGDDFDDNAIEEMDIIASQACTRQEVRTDPGRSAPRRSTSAPAGVSREVPRRRAAAPSEKLVSIAEDDAPSGFQGFESNLLRRGNLNSTFRPKEDVVVETDGASFRRLEKLEQENKKLLEDFMTKEGESVFLRSQLQQTQLRCENERIEKARFIEEQACRHRAELDALHKENENLKTRNEFQALELGTLMDRCKLLEAGTIKMTQPKNPVASGARGSPESSRFRKLGATKSVRVNETSVQTDNDDPADPAAFILKTCESRDVPLGRVPRSIFEPSMAEKSVVDIEIVEKIGRRNLPILQEEETFRIFENPVLVKPIASIVNGRRLSVEFFTADLAAMMRKTRAEINSEECVPIVNKMVSATRELLLNATIVLRTIFGAMKNDDIRDMNDLYLSEFYNRRTEARPEEGSICESRPWYEAERGIEARRAVGALSYVAEGSDYLCEYITGKTRLTTDRDEDYLTYEREMVRYGGWAKRGHKFEILEMMLEFVEALGLVRRSHQFSGLICAIARILTSVQSRLDFCPLGLEYARNILGEMILSRPLDRCFPSITRMMDIFCKLATFGSSLCLSRANLYVSNGLLHFTSAEACPLEVYTAQIERFRFDPVVTIEMSDAFLSAVNRIVLTERVPWITDSPRSCNCCSRVLSYAITLLSECSRIDLGNAEDTPSNATAKRRQLSALKRGVRLLSYLAKRDPDFVTRASNIEDAFHLFVKRLERFEGLASHENEREALTLIKTSLSPERANVAAASAAERGRPSQRAKTAFRVTSAFEKRSVPSVSSGRWFEIEGSRESSAERVVAAYRELLNAENE